MAHSRARWRGCALERQLYSASLRARRYDLIVHLSEHPRGAWLARLLGARYSVAPAMPERGAFWQQQLHASLSARRGGRRHQVEVNLDALRRIGVQPAPHERKVTFVPGAAAEERVDMLASAGGRSSICIRLRAGASSAGRRRRTRS